LIGILGLALILRLWGIGFGLPHRTHIDEPAYVLSALKLASGELRIEYPFFSPNIYQVLLVIPYGILFLLGRVSGIYASAAMFAQSYQTDPTLFYLLARLTSVVFSLGTIIILYSLVKRILGKREALLAAMVLAVNFIDVRHAHFAEPYPLIGFLVLMSVYLGVLFIDHQKVRYLFASGCFAGAATALRFTVSPALFIPFVAFYAFVRTPKTAMQQWKLILLAVCGAVFGFCVAYPGVFIAPDLFWRGFQLFGSLGSGQAGFEGFAYGYPFGALYYLDMSLRLLGIPLILVALTGFVVSFSRLKRYWPTIFVFPLLYFAIIGVVGMTFLRYSVVLLPYLALFSALGIVLVADWFGSAIPKLKKNLVLVAICGFVVVVPLVNAVMQNVLLSRPDTRLLAKQWVESNVPEGAHIATQWYGPPLATPDDPEAGSLRVYDVDIIDPFRSTSELYTLSYYQSQGVDYVILSSFIYQLSRVDLQEHAERTRFYDMLNEEATLVASFSPYANEQEPLFVFDEIYSPVVSLWQRERPGPVIKIYRLNP
jgi:hypothetical protein